MAIYRCEVIYLVDEDEGMDEDTMHDAVQQILDSFDGVQEIEYSCIQIDQETAGKMMEAVM